MFMYVHKHTYVFTYICTHTSQCKTGLSRHWDDSAGTLSAANFIISDGVNEAMQFDGFLNTGLLVNENVVPYANAGLMPTSAISVEVWFSIHANPSPLTSIVDAGLVSAFSRATNCNAGWVLGYSMNSGLMTIQWRLNRIGFTTDSSASFTALSEPLLYTWIHVVGTYDGQTLRIFVNGQPAADENAVVRVSFFVSACAKDVFLVRLAYVNCSCY
jgi:hypothetical protein